MTTVMRPLSLLPGAESYIPKEQILYTGFNQDSGCFTLGTSHGFRIFNTIPFKDTFFRGIQIITTI